MNCAKYVFPGILLAAAPLALAQESQLQSPQVPEDAIQPRELIAWSSLQNPQPAPEPMPPSEDAVPLPEQARNQQPKVPGDPDEAQAPAQLFTGKVEMLDGSYHLCVGDKAYRLEQQSAFQPYENQVVTILGRVQAGDVIFVTGIHSGS